ncbi:MAG: hypothetical protein QM708_07250 [Propioniciclava sp.]|uniref:hypothetical protein n=1 Tax=Propioniciclava sp. TaxID=2038686 RepID=UPI0039E58E10
MTLPGLEVAPHELGALGVSATRHVERLRASGMLGPALELRAALVLELAQRISRAPAYAVAPLAAQLREALDDLPEQGGDAWDALITAIRGAARCPNCPCPACVAARAELEVNA